MFASVLEPRSRSDHVPAHRFADQHLTGRRQVADSLGNGDGQAGDVIATDLDLAGLAVTIAKRVCELADPNEILVSRTVVDLTAGSGLQFQPCGEHQLKGVPGTWRPLGYCQSPRLPGRLADESLSSLVYFSMRTPRGVG